MEGWGKMRSVPTEAFRRLGMLDDKEGLTDCGQLDDTAKIAELLSFMPDRVGGSLNWDKTEIVLPNPHYGMLIGQVRVPLALCRHRPERVHLVFHQVHNDANTQASRNAGTGWNRDLRAQR